MFYYLKGKVALLGQNTVVLDINGVGFLCSVSLNTISYLEMNQDVKLYTYCNIREDGFDIFGFYTLEEKRCFEMLLGVSGVGPKAALSILSAATPEGLALAIFNGDEKAITAAQGVGKKLAQRIILECKDKMSKESAALSASGVISTVPSGGTNNKINDAASALTVLGFTPAEAGAVLKHIDVEHLTLEEIIKEALRSSLK